MRTNMKKGRLIGQGRTAEVFEWGENKILKLFRQNIHKSLAENEYKISLDICERMATTPKVYGFKEIDNRNGIIYERIDGLTMMKLISLRPWKVKNLAHKLAELHKSIQQEFDFQLPRYKTILKENIASSELLSNDIKKKMYEYIEMLRDDNKLCHGDFHPDNVFVTKDRNVIIDWMTATQGNPLADVARTSIMFKFGVISEKPYLEKKIINVLRNKFYSEYIKHYIDISEVSMEEIEQWELPIAAARLIEGIPESEKVEIMKYINLKINGL